MALSEWPEKFTKPDPNEVNYITVNFDKEMVYDERRSTLQAICIRQRGWPRNLEWVPISVLKKVDGKPVLPTTYFNSLEVDEKFAFRRWPEITNTDQDE